MAIFQYWGNVAEVRLIYVCSIVFRQYLRSVTQKNEINGAKIMTILSRVSSLWSFHWFWWKLETCRVLSDSSLKETHNEVVHNKPKRQRCHLYSTASLLGRSCFAPHAATEWVNGHHDQYLFPVVSGFRIMSILNQCFSRLPPHFFSPGRAPFPLLKERKSLQIRLNKWFSEKPLIIHLAPLA